MMRTFSAIVLAICVGCTSSAVKEAENAPQQQQKVIRTAVIGGMTMTGLWQQISAKFQEETGYQVEVIVTGPRPRLVKAIQEGQVDLLTMHSGDITTDVVADGLAINMRPWTRNDLVIVGPKSDPAGIRGMADAAEAFRRIAETESNFVDFGGIGSREVCHKLWKRAGVSPQGSWLLQDQSGGHLNTLEYAKEHNAYVVVGRMPVLYGKLEAEGMEIMIEGDPAMQRPYVVMEANPARFPDANHEGAALLADFLLSDTVQKMLADFRFEADDSLPLFHPIK